MSAEEQGDRSAPSSTNAVDRNAFCLRRRPAPGCARLKKINEPCWIQQALFGVVNAVLSALEKAFGPGDTVEVYTAQKNHVVERLLSVQTHIQPWSASAAYDSSRGVWRNAHRCAYLWMAQQFARRMNRPLLQAPVWVSFDLDTMMQSREREKVVALLVPRAEILLGMYEPWSERVLYGWCTDHEIEACWVFHSRSCSCTRKRRRVSWESMFNLTGTSLEWQGVIDRIEPEWVVRIVDGPVQA